MEALTQWLIKSVLISAILTLYYLIFLRNKKFNQYNRYYLLMTLAASVILPVLNLDFYKVSQPENSLSIYILNTMARKEEAEFVREPGFQWGWLVIFLVSLISLAMLSGLLVKIIRLRSLAKKYPSVNMDGMELFMTDLEQAPFSFGRQVFWKKSIDLQSEEGMLILEHERIHIREKHSYDKIAAQLTVCILWINPFFWLIRNELSLIHEFIADSGSVGEDTVSFAKMLLSSRDSGRRPDIENSFFHSPIKRRLIMITQTKAAPFSYLRRIAILPLSMLLIFMISFTVSKAQNEPTDTAKLRKLESEAKQDPFKQMEPQPRSLSPAEMKEMLENIIKYPPADRKFFIDGKQVPAEKIKKLKISLISDAQMLPPEDAMKKFGVSGEKGIISFMLKKKSAS